MNSCAYILVFHNYRKTCQTIHQLFAFTTNLNDYRKQSQVKTRSSKTQNMFSLEQSRTSADIRLARIPHATVFWFSRLLGNVLIN